MSCLPTYRGNPNNPGYASHLDRFIEVMQPELWVHGHIHDFKDYEIGNTRIVANPRGYHSEGQQTGFNPNLIIEV
jgi:Icc-related predicted phosphoesterase